MIDQNELVKLKEEIIKYSKEMKDFGSKIETIDKELKEVQF